MRSLRFAYLLMDAACVDLWRSRSAYPKDPLRMTWGDFWHLAKD